MARRIAGRLRSCGALPACVVRFVPRAVAPQCVQDASELACDRNGGDVLAAPLFYRRCPLGDALEQAAKKRKLAHITPNDLRRTCATRLLAAGVSFELAAKVLGHVNSKMLQEVYGQLTGEELGHLIEGQIAQQAGPETSHPKNPDHQDEQSDDSEPVDIAAVAPPGLEPGLHVWTRILNRVAGTQECTIWLGFCTA